MVYKMQINCDIMYKYAYFIYKTFDAETNNWTRKKYKN